MKGMKKLLSILMVLTLVLSLGATAFAAEAKTVNVTVYDDGATYTAYQIFKGSYGNGKDIQADGTTKEALGQIEWGDDIDETTFIAKLRGIAGIELSESPSAADVAEAIAAPGVDAVAVADAAYASRKAEAKGTTLTKEGPNAIIEGYYVIVSNDAGEDGAYNHVLLQLGGDIEIKKKADGPKFDKEVLDVNDSGRKDDDTWGEAADHDIGDDVSFRLTATTPTAGEGYKDYKVIFHDTLSKGLTLNSDSFEITVGGTKLDKSQFTDLGITINTTGPFGDGCTFEITIENVMAEGVLGTDWLNKKIIVDYTAKLNEEAIIGVPGNPNDAHLQYDDNPNDEGAGDKTEGETPEVEVRVYTWEMDVDKVHETTEGKLEPLDGAAFTLYKWSGTAWEEYDVIATGTTFEFEGLDDGVYKLEETTVPAGYNKADIIYFEITATHDAEGNASLTITQLTADAESGTFTEYKESTGQFKVTTGVADDKAEDGDPSKDSDAGIFKGTIENKRGVELPETGGIGTTIFYIAGAVLVIGAMILLVTKKRVSGMEK